MAMPWVATSPHLASVRTLVSFRPLPVPPIATTASAVSSCSAASSVMSSVIASPLSPLIASVISVAAPRMISLAPARTIRTRGWRTRDSLDAERSQERDVDRAQLRAGQPDLESRGGIGVGRQHAVARCDGGERLRGAAVHLHGVQRRHRVGASGHGLAGIDAGRQRGQRSIGRCVERCLRAHRIAVAERERGGRMAGRRHDVGGEGEPQRARERLFARRDRPDPRDRSLPARRPSGVSRAIRWISESATI